MTSPIEERATPEFHTDQGEQGVRRIETAAVVRAEELLHRHWIEEPTPLETLRREDVVQQRPQLALEPPPERRPETGLRPASQMPSPV